MTKARSYINLINEFWADFDNRGLSSQAVMLYFYIINRINRNRWQPVTISDRKLSQELSLGRNGLVSYRRQLTDNGLLTCTDNAAEGRTYSLPVEVPDNEPLRPAAAPVDAGGGAERSHFQSEEVAPIEAGGGVEKSHLQSEVALVEAGGGVEWSHFEPKTPYYIKKTNKTCIDLKTTKTEPSPNAELTRAGNVYLNRRQRATEQAELTVQAFFAECNRPNLDVLCMQNGLDHVALQQVARRIADDWIQDGRCHTDSGGTFDLGDAVRHMRNTIPKKISAERRAGDPGRMSREEHRLRLMQTVTERVNDMIAGRVVDEPEPASPF